MARRTESLLVEHFGDTATGISQTAQFNCPRTQLLVIVKLLKTMNWADSDRPAFISSLPANGHFKTLARALNVYHYLFHQESDDRLLVRGLRRRCVPQRGNVGYEGKNELLLLRSQSLRSLFRNSLCAASASSTSFMRPPHFGTAQDAVQQRGTVAGHAGTVDTCVIRRQLPAILLKLLPSNVGGQAVFQQHLPILGIRLPTLSRRSARILLLRIDRESTVDIAPAYKGFRRI